MLADLPREDLVVAVNGHLEPSLKGSALAQATAAKPLVRRTAELLVSEVVARAKAINADNEWAYRVGMLVVFGSFVGGAERPNDVDVACKLEPRWRGEAQSEAEDERRLFSDRRFRNISECVVWPKLEVLRFLKSRSRGLALAQ